MTTSVIIKRHRNMKFTTYQLSGDTFTAREESFRLRSDNGKLSYARGALKFTDEGMKRLDERATQLATAIFDLPGVVNDHFNGTGVVIKQDEMTITRDIAATSDQELEAQVIETISRVLGLAESEIQWAIDDYERSEEFCRKVDASAREYLESALIDDFDESDLVRNFEINLDRF